MVELSEISYYRLNRILLSIIGQWPFQSVKRARITFFIMMTFLLSQLYLQITSMINYWPDMDMVVESVLPLIIATVCAAKMSNCILNKKKCNDDMRLSGVHSEMKELLIRMQNHWTSLYGLSDVQILRDFASDSQNMTKIYLRIMYGALFIFVLVPTLQSIGENVIPGQNVTYPLLFPVDNIINVKKYHIYLLIHSYISTFYFITIMVSVDTMFITYVSHCCGMFDIIGHRLKNITGKGIQNPAEWCDNSDDDVHSEIIKCIQSHIDILHFADQLQSAFSKSFLFQMGFNMIVISVTGIQIVYNMDNPDQAMRWLPCGLGQILHLYMQSFPSQKLIDHSLNMQNAVYFSPWYSFPLKSRPLIKIILMRVLIPCQITAGKMYVISLESFGVVLKTSMSYFTLFLSVR